MVAIFNLESKSKILKYKDQDGTDVLLPCKTIKAHTHYISGKCQFKPNKK